MHTPMAMAKADPATLLAEMKRTESLLRDARSLLRRVDTLAKTAGASDDPSLPAIAEVRSATERLVMLLGHRQQTERRSVKQAARRAR
jgi:hypothetical protein